jgi:L-ascorbate metabolism protein UlaG (beta-lactamase superfamily)
MRHSHLDSHYSARITFVGHATTLVEMSGIRILTDPVIRHRLRFLKRRFAMSASPVDFQELDAVVLSHMHFDHMDYPSLRMIPRHTPIIAPEGASRYLARRVGHDIVEMGVGDKLRIGEVEIHATPCRHDTGFYWPMWHPKTVLSYMFVGSQTIFFVGDTALFESMRDLGECYDIDAALLPVWGFGPYLRGDHMTPEEAAHALSMLLPRVAIPIHWGTLHPLGPWWKKMGFLHRPPRAFALEAMNLAPDTDVRVLAPGASTLIEPVPEYELEPTDVVVDGAQLEPALA